MKTKINFKSLIFYLGITFLFGFLGNRLGGSTDIYSTLILPPLSPPAFVFPIVWSIIYFLIGISAYIVSMSEIPEKETALNIYMLQLVINSLWSLLFFRLNLYFISFIWIVLLFFIVAFNTLIFYKINKISGLLFIPYLVWLVFAGYLNLMIFILN